MKSRDNPSLAILGLFLIVALFVGIFAIAAKSGVFSTPTSSDTSLTNIKDLQTQLNTPEPQP